MKLNKVRGGGREPGRGRLRPGGPSTAGARHSVCPRFLPSREGANSQAAAWGQGPGA